MRIIIHITILITFLISFSVLGCGPAPEPMFNPGQIVIHKLSNQKGIILRRSAIELNRYEVRMFIPNVGTEINGEAGMIFPFAAGSVKSKSGDKYIRHHFYDYELKLYPEAH